MTPDQFAEKWARAQLRERSGSQEHFLDICRLVGESTPAEADPNGDFFTFEKSLKKESGATGFADVWRRDCFAWEYKGLHADLSAAYGQLQLYRESLGNPPLLVVCDMDRYEVHTNFNNTVKRVYRFSNSDFPSDQSVDGTQLTPNPPKDTDGRREDSGRGVRELQARLSGLDSGRREVAGRPAGALGGADGGLRWARGAR